VDQQYYRSSLSTGAPLPLTPLIDVVFLIVVFFMVNATFAVHSTIPVQLPHADGDNAAGSAALSITVDAAGQIFIRSGGDAVAVTLDRLHSALAALQPDGPVSRAVLHGAAGARYGRLVAVMDVLRGAGVTDIDLVTARPSATP
jgi:biopolymer transport protein ExbD